MSIRTFGGLIPENVVRAASDAVTGELTHLIRPTGRASSLGITPARPRILKQFNDLTNITLTPSTITIVSSIDQNSPFGGPALKVVVTAGSTGYFNADITNLNIPLFNGHLATDIWVDEPHRISSVITFAGKTTNFANSTQWSQIMFSAGQMIGGHRVFYGGPLSGAAKAVNGAGFTFGVDTLVAMRVRVTVFAGANTTLWIRRMFIPAKQRPIVCFTFDDASISWATIAAPLLAANRVKATFGVQTGVIGTDHGLYCDSADILALKAAGHQISCHNVNNYALQQLYSHGNGETNGASPPSPPQDSVLYLADYHTSRQTLEGYGIDAEDFCYFPWVQGKAHHQGSELMRSAGVEVARLAGIEASRPGGVNLYGFQMGNNAMSLIGSALAEASASVPTLAQNKVLVDDTITYGGLLIFYGHIIAAASGSDTISSSDLSELLAYVASKDVDILTIRELRDRLYTLRALDAPSTNPLSPVRMIGRLYGANMNSTADQAITLPAGSWIITQCYAAKSSVSLTTAAGGIYTGAGKTGTAAVAAGQVYTALTGVATDVAVLTVAATPTVTLASASTGLYLSLTTAQGVAATADIFVYGRPA